MDGRDIAVGSFVPAFAVQPPQQRWVIDPGAGISCDLLDTGVVGSKSCYLLGSLSIRPWGDIASCGLHPPRGPSKRKSTSVADNWVSIRPGPKGFSPSKYVLYVGRAVGPPLSLNQLVSNRPQSLLLQHTPLLLSLPFPHGMGLVSSPSRNSSLSFVIDEHP